MKTSEIIPVFFTVDEKYAPYLSTALISLIEHASPENNYEINVIFHHLSPLSRARIARLARNYSNIRINLIAMQRTIEGIFDRKETRLKADCFTPTIYYRIFLPEMFQQYDRGIYLDSDVIVMDDVAKLYRTDINDYLLAACLDMSTFGNPLFTKYFNDAIGVSTDGYFNSGVLLINFKRFREEEFGEHFLYLLNTYDFDTVAPDQDYLNAMCKDRVKYLNITWNTMPTAEAKEKHPKIVHFNLFFKPWHYDGTRYEEYFWQYAKKSPYYRIIMREKENFVKNGKMGDDERLIQMSNRVEEILRSDVTFRKVFDSGKERRS